MGWYGVAVADCDTVTTVARLPFAIPRPPHARYRCASGEKRVIRLRFCVYSAVAMGGSIANYRRYLPVLYQHLGGGVFWMIMALVACPLSSFGPKWLPRHDSRILRICCC